MRIRIITQQDPDYDLEAYPYSLSYDPTSHKFFMEASGYFIRPLKAFKPLRIHFQWNGIFITFASQPEARDFHKWLIDANKEAEKSFR